ncbi:unnamed protein product [Polarella glacialis]|uniref:Uncharacterized protein n=1 Tax=Polarella glacialis TaxID=89957 RepID=A0A813JNF5_POLGL|nr:unnamed protein product [Polarella glacialis]
MQRSMDSQSRWAALMSEAGIAQPIADAILTRGYASASLFSYAMTSAAQLENFILEVLVTVEALGNGLTALTVATSPMAAGLRRLWWDAWALAQGAGIPAQTGTIQELAWTDAPPPHLSAEVMRNMKQTFQTNYPGEVIDRDTTPSVRLWSTVYQFLRPENVIRWLPWTQLVSEKKSQEIVEARAHRHARSDLQILTQLCWEDVPQLDESDLRPNPFFISQLQAIRRNTFALCGGCHMASRKVFDNKFLNHFTKRYSEESGLRAPSLKETMEADRHLLEEVYKLVNDGGWSLDDALHEMTQVRQDMASLMQPRARPARESTARSSSNSSRTPRPSHQQAQPKSSPSAKAQPKGQAKAIAKGQQRGSRDRVARVRLSDRWDRNWFLGHTDANNQAASICMRCNLESCTTPGCRFLHICPVPKANGEICGAADRRAVNRR